MRLFVLCFTVLLASCTRVEAECDFSKDAITLPVIKKSDIKFKDWNKDEGKYNALLKSGDYLFVKYWACNHFGMSSDLILPAKDVSGEDVKSKIQWLGKAVLSEDNLKLLEEKISSTESFSTDMEIDIDSSNSEFIIKVSKQKLLVIINIYYYFS